MLKTEVIDKKKIASRDYMTSARWMTEKQPHPIYKAVKRNQHKIPFGSFLANQPAYLLVLVQTAYTLLFMLPVKFLYQNYYLHASFLILVFLICLWNGSAFYFEVFSKSYAKRLDKAMQQLRQEQKTDSNATSAAQSDAKINVNSASDDE
jgi:hypothetical protein